MSNSKLPAVTIVAVMLSGCTPGPNPAVVAHDKPMPTCAEIASVLASLGMSQPDIRSDHGGERTETNCRIEPSQPATRPHISSATTHAHVPVIDLGKGVTVEKWGEIWTSNSCNGLKRAISSVTDGSVCYTTISPYTGSATLVGYPNDVGIQVRVMWWDSAATDTDLRAATEQKADDLARRLIAML